MRKYKRSPMIEVFNRHWIPEPFSGCWLWTGSCYLNGYGKFHVANRRESAHRTAYQIYRGPIEKGKVIDHLCRTRSCVNPSHMEVVTIRENLLRGKSQAANQARRTHCIHGHPLFGENLYKHDGHRYCRACRLAQNRKAYERRKVAGE